MRGGPVFRVNRVKSEVNEIQNNKKKMVTKSRHGVC